MGVEVEHTSDYDSGVVNVIGDSATGDDNREGEERSDDDVRNEDE